LGQETALHVRVRGAREDDVLYWRGQTFARYNGRGWEDDWPALIDREYAAGEPWSPQRPTEGRHLVLSSVRVLAASRSVLYAAGEPVSADRPYRAVQRGPGELIALRAAGAAAHYTVLGEVADQDPDLLRAAGTAYPPHIVELYLDLPADLPRRVAEWTAEVTASAATPYDRALAIESALRQISYSLAIPPPPPEQEVVSWFLFELRQGYCDYFATAMAVMARLSGIPSRLAVGYGTGAYEPRIGAYVVTELQAHSWPELYFPGHGWVPFEPTPARVLPLRLAQALPVPFLPEDESLTVLGVEAGLAELRQLAIVEVGATARTVWVGRMIGMVNGLLICWFVSWLGRWWSGVHAARAGGEAAWRYARLAHWGARLGRPLRMADTPREYAQAVAVAAERVVRRARWRKQSVSQAASVVRAEAPRLAEAIERSLYGAELSTEPVTLNAGWRRSSLWPALRRLWFARWHI
jgi:transglutaminase-like putative cysteine protease